MAEHGACSSEGTAREWSMGYVMGYRSVPLVRVHVRRQLALWRWGGDAQDAAVVVSELVTNAIQYGRRIGRRVWVRLAVREDGSLVIDVSDPQATLPPRVLDPSLPGPEEERGRGLFLARGLGAELSWFPREFVGKTVRATLEPGPRPGPTSEEEVGGTLRLP
ncbi:ATP-binding protein [Streptomyces phytophilus]|uniref:ATP-binding protein n=1 Tax=Streptomyces phytophilus TaxID=722715 RepID=UPI0015EFE260|nr:ATP-binding protein [Streptomyces phytophilus]